ncbi:hypothetical protein R1flu_022389 [Riccia fluitans]|uniref:Uncharacterized protein n=1 Tax=Riccia fluitans TaxID=41844 RepID=A0ABD1ZTB3_9MARC
MDVCLGLGLGKTLLTFVQSSWDSSLCRHQWKPSSSMDRPRESNFSWSLLSKSALLQRSKFEMAEPSYSDRISETSSVSSVSDVYTLDDSCSTSSKSSSGSAISRMSLWGTWKREGRKPALLERTPMGRPSGYLTVYVGTRTSTKYAVRKKLLRHPLFQVLLKCSEDEFGEDYRVNKAVSIACEPGLFLEVVKAVDEEIWSASNSTDA